MSILSRFDIIRKDEGLSKAGFEKRISKSNGYIAGLEKREGAPGADVILDVIRAFPEYNLTWLMTGEGEKYKNEKNSPLDNLFSPSTSMLVGEAHEIRRDLKALSEGMTKNFEVLSEAMMQGLLNQRKLLNFTEALDPNLISKATLHLEAILKQEK